MTWWDTVAFSVTFGDLASGFVVAIISYPLYLAALSYLWRRDHDHA